MGNEMMTISAMTRMFRQIPVVHNSPKNEEVCFGDCVRKASESVNMKNEKVQMAEYRQTLYSKLQTLLLISIVFMESVAIYSLVVSLLLIFTF